MVKGLNAPGRIIEGTGEKTDQYNHGFLQIFVLWTKELTNIHIAPKYRTKINKWKL